MKILITDTVFAFVCCVLLAGCYGHSSVVKPGRPQALNHSRDSAQDCDLVHVNSIFLAPVNLDQAARGQLAIAEELDVMTVSAVTSELSLDLVPPQEMTRTFKKKTAIDAPPARTVEEAIEFARRRNRDAILWVSVHEFTDRIGSSMGASRPASVSFSIDLIRVTDRKLLWSSTYHFTDTAISDNLFQLGDMANKGQKVGWRPAREIFLDGMRSAAKELAGRRISQFASDKK